MHKFLKLAIHHARNHTYDEGLEYGLCAVLVKSGNVVSIGFNRMATNGFVEHFADRAKGRMRNFHLSTHAEMDAILRVRNRTDLRGTKIFVARPRPCGDLGLARPCVVCQHVLHSYGIKRAYYTINDNEYGVMRVIDPFAQEAIDRTVVSSSL